VKSEDILGVLTGLFGSDRWPKPLNRMQGLQRIQAGESAGAAAKAVGTNAALLQKLKQSPTPLKELLGVTPDDTPHDLIERTTLILGQLLLGRCAEMAFEGIYVQEMGTTDIALIDLRESRSDTDYRLRNGQNRYLYRINIKFHGARFRRAKDLVGLDPEDCFPLATYKIHGALQKQDEEHLPYIFAIISVPDVSARETGMLVPESAIRTLAFLRYAKVAGMRDLEDRLVKSFIEKGAEPYAATYQKVLKAEWRILSARKAANLLRDKLFDRVYALRVRGFAQQFRGAELDMHLSIAQDMTPLREFLATLRRDGPTRTASLLERGTL
jgi:hypothetical protein